MTTGTSSQKSVEFNAAVGFLDEPCDFQVKIWKYETKISRNVFLVLLGDYPEAAALS